MENALNSECYCSLMKKGASWIADFYNRAMSESGLNASQYFLLRTLQKQGSANITNWAKSVGLERTTMVRNVKVLEKHGYVEQVAGNGKTYALSASGQETLGAAIPVWEGAQEKMKAHLGEEDVEALLRIAGKLRDLAEEGA